MDELKETNSKLMKENSRKQMEIANLEERITKMREDVTNYTAMLSALDKQLKELLNEKMDECNSIIDTWERQFLQTKNGIEENIIYNSHAQIFQLLYEKVLIFDDAINKYYEKEFIDSVQKTSRGVQIFPDYKAELIQDLVLLVLLDIASEEDIEFMQKYAYLSDYLEFIFNPKTFDYKKIKISDKMWCNFINNDYYRDRILQHKEQFWNKNEEKRIELGFGTSFENRVAYKYLFD